MFDNLRIGRVFGIDLKLHSTFWLLPAFMFITGWLRGGAPAAALDTAWVLAVFGCVALHELGHALAARWYGIRTQDITLYPIGGIARLERIPERAWPEIVIAMAGPMVNVIIALLLVPLVILNGIAIHHWWPSTGDPIHAFLVRVLFSNVLLVLFNLIPAFPMDGGRVFRALLSLFTDRVTATNWAARLGSLIAIGFGIWAVLETQPFLFILAISVFIMGRQEAQMVRQIEAHRRQRRMWFEAGWSDPRPDTPDRRDGWVYDADRGEWVDYRGRDRFRRV